MLGYSIIYLSSIQTGLKHHWLAIQTSDNHGPMCRCFNTAHSVDVGDSIINCISSVCSLKCIWDASHFIDKKHRIRQRIKHFSKITQHRETSQNSVTLLVDKNYSRAMFVGQLVRVFVVLSIYDFLPSLQFRRRALLLFNPFSICLLWQSARAMNFGRRSVLPCHETWSIVGSPTSSRTYRYR